MSILSLAAKSLVVRLALDVALLAMAGSNSAPDRRKRPFTIVAVDIVSEIVVPQEGPEEVGRSLAGVDVRVRVGLWVESGRAVGVGRAVGGKWL